MPLANDTKVKVCNAFDALRCHIEDTNCWMCAQYLHYGDGDLCETGKEKIATELAYADTSLVRQAAAGALGFVPSP